MRGGAGSPQSLWSQGQDSFSTPCPQKLVASVAMSSWPQLTPPEGAISKYWFMLLTPAVPHQQTLAACESMSGGGTKTPCLDGNFANMLAQSPARGGTLWGLGWGS